MFKQIGYFIALKLKELLLVIKLPILLIVGATTLVAAFIIVVQLFILIFVPLGYLTVYLVDLFGYCMTANGFKLIIFDWKNIWLFVNGDPLFVRSLMGWGLVTTFLLFIVFLIGVFIRRFFWNYNGERMNQPSYYKAMIQFFKDNWEEAGQLARRPNDKEKIIK